MRFSGKGRGNGVSAGLLLARKMPKLIPHTPRWQRAQCLPVSPTLLPNQARAKSK